MTNDLLAYQIVSNQVLICLVLDGIKINTMHLVVRFHNGRIAWRLLTNTTKYVYYCSIIALKRNDSCEFETNAQPLIAFDLVDVKEDKRAFNSSQSKRKQRIRNVDKRCNQTPHQTKPIISEIATHDNLITKNLDQIDDWNSTLGW